MKKFRNLQTGFPVMSENRFRAEGVVMNIYICDDQEGELKQLQQIVLEYAAENPELCIAAQCFVRPLDLLNAINTNGAPDIALLDICMPGILGTEVAKEILNKSEGSTDIIFLTTSSDFAVEAFSLHASDYLMKPYTKQRLNDTLDRVMKKRRSRLYAPILCGTEIHRIDLYTVLYAEVINHNVELHLKSGKCLKTRTTLTELKKRFDAVSGFVPVGASYLVNLRCVQSLRQTALEMTDGAIIPVPRRLRGELKKQYFEFYKKEATGQCFI